MAMLSFFFFFGLGIFSFLFLRKHISPSPWISFAQALLLSKWEAIYVLYLLNEELQPVLILLCVRKSDTKNRTSHTRPTRATLNCVRPQNLDSRLCTSIFTPDLYLRAGICWNPSGLCKCVWGGSGTDIPHFIPPNFQESRIIQNTQKKRYPRKQFLTHRVEGNFTNSLLHALNEM